MNKVVVIAEAGVNHNGDMKLAKSLIDVAAEAGVDFVKFQSFCAGNIASKWAAQADYQKENTGKVESQLEMLQKLELSLEDHHELINYCRNKNVAFLSTPFDLVSIHLLKSLGITIGKIPSGEITNKPYLQEMAKTFSELIVSTGMCDLKEVGEALDVILETGFTKDKITLLHCNTEYPTPFEDVNLSAMLTMAKEFGVRTGYSDHTTGIEVPVAATALGATVIEKHFTLDRNMEGPDHKASLEPGELADMVRAVRNIEKAIGHGKKIPTPSESRNKIVARKSLVASRQLSKGHVITEADLATKRPGSGISPMMIDKVIGKPLLKDIGEDETLTAMHVSL